MFDTWDIIDQLRTSRYELPLPRTGDWYTGKPVYNDHLMGYFSAF